MKVCLQYPRTVLTLGLMPLVLTARLQPSRPIVRARTARNAPAEAA